MAELTTKQELFVQHYLATRNGSEAVRRAGYKTTRPDQIAYENLRKPEIQAAIQARMREIMPPEEVIWRLADQARGSMGDFLRVDEEEVTLAWSLITAPLTEEGEVDVGGLTLRLAMQDNVQPTDRVLHTATVKRSVARLDLLKAAGKLHLVKKYSLDEKGKVAIELYDAHAALVDIGRVYGLFVDKKEVSGPGGGPVDIGVRFIDYRDGLAETAAGSGDDSASPGED